MKVIDQVIKTTCELFEVPVSEARLLPETDLHERFGPDSLDLVELVMDLEDTFKVSISDEVWEKAVTVQDVVDLVEGQLARKEVPNE